MLNSSLLRGAFALVALLFVFGTEEAAQADEPFYYPAYGSHRGRIRYVDGVLRDKQRIRWGNGFTDNGVLVMRDLAAAAVKIVPALVPNHAGPESEEESKARGAAIEEVRAEDEQLQTKADGIRSANQSLLERLTAGKPDSAEVGPKPGPVSKGLRVLVIYEFKDKASDVYSREQVEVLNSEAVKIYLDSHCAKDGEGTAEWRMWDDDFSRENVVDMDKEEWWTRYDDALKSSGEKRPWLVVYKDLIKAAEMELPAGEGKMLEVLKAHGGP